MNSFGNLFRISLFGESHGPIIGVTIDGLPAGIALSEELFKEDLARRRGASLPGTTPRREEDRPQFLSGLYEGHTTGAPLTIAFENQNQLSNDYTPFVSHFRPSHADFVAHHKFKGYNDPRGGGHFSGRLTVALTAAGVVAKQLLPNARFFTSICSIGGESDPAKFDDEIRKAMAEGDSVGGVVECRIEGLPIGLGEPLFDSVESLASHLLFSIPGVRGVEFGRGFEASRMRGSEHNDPILDSMGRTASNHAGGVVGGLTNGNPLIVRVAFKPTASIAREQLTYNAASGRPEPLKIGGRHDSCIALRGAVVVEAAMAIVLAELTLREGKR